MKLPLLVRATAASSLLALAFSACSDGGGVAESVGSSSAAITPIPGCDYSFARPAPSSLVSMGYKFVVRYLSGDPGGGKDITSSERSSLEGAGLDVVLNWETTGTDATDGYNQGVADATSAKSEAASVGQPSTRPIYFSIDFDADSGDAASINEYFKGVASVLGLSRTGVYGGYYIVNELLNEGLVDWAWQAYAWSNGQWDSRNKMEQIQNGADNDEIDIDQGMVADFGQFGPNAPTSPAYAAQYVAQSFPLATTALDMTQNQTVAAWIELKNVGTATWNSSTHLGTTEPEDSVSIFAAPDWLSTDRPAGVTGTVAPGATYKFQFNLHAPENKTGTFEQYFGVVQEGVTWFSAASQGGPADDDLEVKITVGAADYQGTFVSQTYPGAPSVYTMTAGETSTGSITMKNTGTKPWVAGTTKLAPIPRDTASPFATPTWLAPTRVSSVAAAVAPGDTGVFELPLKAPTTPGTYTVELGLVEESVAWFADAPDGAGPADGFLRVDVKVVAPEGGPTPDTDASTPPVESDAGVVLDGSVFATDAGIEAGSGSGSAPGTRGEPGSGTGAVGSGDLGSGTGHGKHDDAGQGNDATGDDEDGSVPVGANGGCSTAPHSSPDLSILALVGLAVVVSRRRTKKAA